MESGWYNLKRRKTKVDRVVGWYDVWTGDLPFAKFTVKVIESADGGFFASPNVFVKSNDGIEYTGGVGATVQEAVLDCTNRFYDEIEKVSPIESITEDAFVWLAWTPFGIDSTDSSEDK